ncbi:hypothetical protein ACHAXT_002237 [Thalassiosira profunda]
MPGRLFLVSTPLVVEQVVHDKSKCGRTALCTLSNLGRIDGPVAFDNIADDDDKSSSVAITGHGFGQTQRGFGADLFIGVATIGGTLTTNVTYTEPLHSTADIENFLKAVGSLQSFCAA